jgi:hypothetical protein
MTGSTICRTAALALVLLAGFSATACETDPSDRIIAFDLRGAVRVILFRDENFSSTLTSGDAPVPLARVILLRSATRADSTHLFTDSLGSVLFEPVDVGQYRIDLAPSVLGDSLLRIDPDRTFTVPRGDTILVAVGVRFPSLSISEARNLPIGKKVHVRGIALTTVGTFGDSTLHIADSVSAIRMSRVRPQFPVDRGDSLQLLGVRAVRDGQPTFNVVPTLTFAIRGVGDQLPPDSIRTNLAGSADGGKQDANLVRVFAATIADTLTSPDGKTFTVNDGSGPVRVLLDNNINFGTQAQLNAYAPGVKVNLSGVLVPNPLVAGTWMLKPRERLDITIVP